MAMLRPCDNQTKPHYPPTRTPFTLRVYAVAGVYATRSDIANYVTVIMVMLGNRRYRPCDDSERIPNPNYVLRFTFYTPAPFNTRRMIHTLCGGGAGWCGCRRGEALP